VTVEVVLGLYYPRLIKGVVGGPGPVGGRERGEEDGKVWKTARFGGRQGLEDGKVWRTARCGGGGKVRRRMARCGGRQVGRW
jgi:hypothetical protein